MKLPRDVSGSEVVKALRVLGYRVVRQQGSHIQLTTLQLGEHHLTVPEHRHLKIGTLTEIVKRAGSHFGLTAEEIVERLFGER